MHSHGDQGNEKILCDFIQKLVNRGLVTIWKLYS